MLSTVATMDYSPRIKKKQRLNISKALGNSKFQDVTFIVGPNKIEFKANRMLLALISPVFEAMLYGPMQEGKTDSVITIDDVDEYSFRSVLHYAYLKNPHITNNDIRTVVGVKNICRKYNIADLSSECDEYFERSINAESICLLLDQSIKYKLDEYVTKCMDKMKRIGRSAPEIVHSDGFMKMGTESIRLLLQCDYLQIKEEQLWDAVVKWSEGLSKGLNSGNNDDIDQEPPPKRRRFNVNQSDLLRSVCPYIRFGLMDMKYFTKKVKPTGCLTKDEVISVFEYMAMKEDNADYQCDKFSTKPRKGTLGLRRFDVFSAAHHAVSVDGLNICGVSSSCQAYWSYPETVEPRGYTKGLHFWSIQLMKAYCFRGVAVVSNRKSAKQIADHFKCESLSEAASYSWGPVPNIVNWGQGQVLTAVLDCDRGGVDYYIGQELKKHDNIKQGKPHWFAMILCAKSNRSHCRSVETPEEVVEKYEICRN